MSAVFLVYNIAKRETLEKLGDWLKEARENSNPKIVTVLVGAQNDLESEYSLINHNLGDKYHRMLENNGWSKIKLIYFLKQVQKLNIMLIKHFKQLLKWCF